MLRHTALPGALELATKGNWEGKWCSEFSDYEVVSIDGPPIRSQPKCRYWSFWLNNKYEEEGVCHAQLESGEQVLFFPACTTGHQRRTCEPDVLGIEAPPTAEVGRAGDSHRQPLQRQGRTLPRRGRQRRRLGLQRDHELRRQGDADLPGR